MFVTSAPSRSPPSADGLDVRQGQARDVDQPARPLDVLLHQVDQVRAAGDELGRAVRGDLAHGGRHVAGPGVGKGVHRPAPLSPACITCSMAATMFGYAPHRQRLPLISSRMSSAVFARPSVIKPTAEQIWPGVQ